MRKLFYTIIVSLFFFTFSYCDIVVGTTGDYLPFSNYDKTTNTFNGKDIQLIKEFAKTQKENVKFVKTSWKTASDDLKANKFQVFVGGMTITPQRQKDFVFSTPLATSRKAAMTDCKNLSKYKNFEDIDNSKTLVIENRGGTNESFALQILKNANLLIINDNKLAIKSITNGLGNIHPNIMITDSVEIAYQHSINPQVCQIPVQIDKSSSYKAFMFNKTPQDKKLANQFNQWLKNNPDILKKYNKD
ncbi:MULTISPECIES: transporter substrate-binding domain-containing protein [unclassified Francisella]|uniref:transporter substrate-binding domain-containing protein n=1 Tax=unclassified Francisella TaxID=2610885 RepID=UPI002E355079|nr:MULTISPECIES: transporter substrate-binding domain-containing protein [unclassified Francisella]MED7819192.1 transporter substrate-binding domain-containing protein [Francisella sp. 19S2-4]MED7829988.1 transporter substrate-binding domain-containing protein [Francisella sp. 19S2-10]